METANRMNMYHSLVQVYPPSDVIVYVENIILS